MGLSGKPRGAPTIGVNIGSSLIKVVEAKPGKDGILITALGVAPTPPGTIDNEVIVDPQTLGQAIRQLIKESGITCKRCVSSVSGQSTVVVRIIEVPKMTPKELGETMKWEVERHVPFAANDVVMDFQAIDRPMVGGDDENMEVLLAVAQQEVINKHIEAIYAAGLDPVVVDVEPLAICRALIDSSKNGAREQTIAIVNIGAAVTDMGIYQNGLLAFPRTLPIAGDSITRALSDGLNISIDQAERLKRERAAVLMDRAALLNPAMGFGAPGTDDQGVPDATIGIPTPANGSAAGDDDLGFIPGLGFGFGTDPEPDPSATSNGSNGTPDFDVDLGGGMTGMPFMDFDLAEPDAAAAPGAPKLDLSEPVDFQAASGPAMAGADGSAAFDDAQLAAFTDEQIFEAIGPMLNDLIMEMRRSLEYYASRFQTQPDKILLCGGTSKLKDLDKLIQSELGVPVVVGNPLENVTVFSRTLSQDYLTEVASVFPVCIGLAIRDMLGE
jgi:type IV pilus assembly protein PilM